MKTLQATYNPSKKAAVKEPIQVLHIIKSLGRGGAETLLPETLSKHNQDQFHFHYIYFLPWKNQMVEQIKAAGGKVSCFKANNDFQIFTKVRMIAAYVKENGISLIHCHLPWAGIVGRMVGKLTGVPVVYTEHNKWERYHKLTYFLNKVTFSSQQRVIAVSNDVAASIKLHHSKAGSMLRVVSNGINTEKFSPSLTIEPDIRKKLNIPDSAVVIGIACVFRVQKRLLVWLEIAAALWKKFPHLHFIIAGDGPLKEVVHAKAKELNLSRNLHFVGLQQEIRPYLKAMDVFMMSSEFEGLPIALLEAMSMQCVPACTAAGGIPELIKNGVNGILVPVNQPMQLIEKLEKVLGAPQTLRKLGEKARTTVENEFGLQQMVDQLESIYTELLNHQS